MLSLSLLLEISLGICSIAHDYTSIEKKRVVFQFDFDEIDRSLLRTELSFLGFWKFCTDFSNCDFIPLFKQKMPP